jgi:branched-chain amino acid transport system ATP-binding protein
VNLDVQEGEVVTILGLNGAGKSTLCKAVLGMVPAVSGTVIVQGQDISNWPVHKRVREAGIALCPEGRQIFRTQTVLENVLLAGDVAKGSSSQRLSETLELFPEMAQRKNQMAGTLSGGQQQMLALGRALMSGPRLLLIDEASLGLTPEVVSRIWEALGVLQRSGLSLLVIEQRVNESLTMAQRVYVLDRGRVVFTGVPKELQEEGMLKKMYFGGH